MKILQYALTMKKSVQAPFNIDKEMAFGLNDNANESSFDLKKDKTESLMRSDLEILNNTFVQTITVPIK